MTRSLIGKERPGTRKNGISGKRLSLSRTLSRFLTHTVGAQCAALRFFSSRLLVDIIGVAAVFHSREGTQLERRQLTSARENWGAHHPAPAARKHPAPALVNRSCRSGVVWRQDNPSATPPITFLTDSIDHSEP